MSISTKTTAGNFGGIKNKIPSENVRYTDCIQGRNIITQHDTIKTLPSDSIVDTFTGTGKRFKIYKGFFILHIDNNIFYKKIDTEDAFVQLINVDTNESVDVADSDVDFIEITSQYGDKLLITSQSSYVLIDQYSLPYGKVYFNELKTKFHTLFQGRVLYVKDNAVFGSSLFEATGLRAEDKILTGSVSNNKIDITSGFEGDYISNVSVHLKYNNISVSKIVETTDGVSESVLLLTGTGVANNTFEVGKQVRVSSSNDIIHIFTIKKIITFGDDKKLFLQEDIEDIVITNGIYKVHNENKEGSFDNVDSTINYIKKELAFNNITDLFSEYIIVYSAIDESKGVLPNATSVNPTSAGPFTQYVDSKINGIVEMNEQVLVFEEKDISYLKLANSSDPSSIIYKKYRRGISIENHHLVIPTSAGIFFIHKHNDEKFLGFLTFSEQSDILDISRVAVDFNWDAYDFSNGYSKIWKQYVIFTAQEIGHIGAENNVFIIYDTENDNVFINNSDSFDIDVNNNQGIYSISNVHKEILVKFSGFKNKDVSKSVYSVWESPNNNLGVESFQKKVRKLELTGKISGDISIEGYYSYDNGDYTKILDISNTGSISSSVGTDVVGRTVIGVRSSELNDIKEFRHTIRIPAPRKFHRRKLKIIIKGHGYMEISRIREIDVWLSRLNANITQLKQTESSELLGVWKLQNTSWKQNNKTWQI